MRLKNTLWQIEIDPATLSLHVVTGEKSSVPVSQGSASHTVEDLKQSDTQASWRWSATGFAFEVTLREADLEITVRASVPSELTVLQMPFAALGKALILPLAEGSYIPTENALWQQFLREQMNELNTTEDLSLPLWGMEYKNLSLHWLLLQPFNNTLRFVPDKGGFGITLQHRFTRLGFRTPFTALLHLGDKTAVLAGAKRYRRWLIEKGRFEPLAEKIAQVPAAKKLLGAPHVYLWGTGLLSPKDIRDWPAFLRTLRGGTALATDIRKQMEPESQTLLTQLVAKPMLYQQRDILRAVNAALTALARKSWQVAEPDMGRLTTRYSELRTAVATTFGRNLQPDPALWGGGLSVATITALQKAGLKNLWIGLGDGWEGGLWNPEAVRAGVQVGYLLAPYDSYETALPTGTEPDWATAHLGEKAYRDAAIVREDDSLKSGFRQAGHYTDPRAVRPLLQRRIRAIQQKVGFNRWFLDAYAAGMVFDNYRRDAPLTQEQMADEYTKSDSWGAEALKLVTGSERGNAITARGICFAHGMQTPVIGWGDPDLQKDRKSPYYLGAWYPNDSPAVFFKPTPMKEPYRTVYFDPQFRLPLYQSVFHGSVIITHHWSLDSLKLTNVRAENELAQFLYNVPPLYHLSAETLTTRLPALQRQDTLFRPLHQRLATQELTHFRWLTPDRLLQETRFTDGTRLTANFSKADRIAEGQKLPALSVLIQIPGKSSEIYRVG